MKRMLFNATQAEELRVAIVDGQKLVDLDIESANKEQRKGNIYKAVITRLEPSLEAAFVEYGAERHGFLPFKEVARSYFRSDGDPGKARIQDALQVGQEVIVQVDKDERGNKGAALTTFISLAGRYLVLMPNNPRGGGVSRRIEGEDRQELREIMDRLEVPASTSLIARTAGIGRSYEELQWDLNYLLQLWSAIEGAANSQKGAFLIYQESSLVIRAIRDYFTPDIGEILIDTDDVFEQAQQFMAHVMPGNVARVKRYHDDVPLFSRFQIEHQIESAYSRQVTLPSGGAIVIDHTEALVSVDVNSGRATRGADIEETAFKTNLEAADETARQLRLRDLGGLIVIDFIDMESTRNQREVENRLRDALHFDRARVQTGKISRFGLLELSRQRLRPALAEMSYIPCPRCSGTGHIRSTESSALHILRILEEEAMKENTGALHCQIPVDVATFLLNEKRIDISKIEMRHKVNLVLIPNINMETPAHQIVRLRHDQLNLEETALPSYKMADLPPEQSYTPPSAQTDVKIPRQEAAVKAVNVGAPAPIVEPRAEPEPKPASQPGLWSRIVAWFSGPVPESEPSPEKPQRPPRRDSRPEGRGELRRGGRGRRDGGRSERPPKPEAPTQADRPEKQERAEKIDAAREPRRSRGDKDRPAAEVKEAREPKAQREPREPREPRPPRQPRPQPAAEAAGAGEIPAIVAPGGDATAEEGQRARRGRRGGRREKRGEEMANLAGESANATAAPPSVVEEAAPLATESATTVTTAPAAEAPASTSLPVSMQPALHPLVAAPQAEAELATEPSPAVAVPVTEPAPVVEPVPLAAAIADEASTVAPVPVEAAAVPRPVDTVEAASAVAAMPTPVGEPASADLSATLKQVGLELVETRSTPSPATLSDETPMPRGRKPRPVTVPADEPLQMVETRPEARP